MPGRAQDRRLPDGRLHLHHGPIDLIIEAEGEEREVEKAYRCARQRFDTILDELVSELPLLRHPLADERPDVSGRIAARMVDAAWPHRPEFLTPMIAVAGAVADEVLDAIVEQARSQGGGRRGLRRAYVNNGGDIALYLTPGTSFTVGLVSEVERGTLAGSVVIEHDNPARGIATSGWRGRSVSFGIADAVTVTGLNAAAADAAATLIANAVKVGHPSIERRPADEITDWTDLGEREVTVGVHALPTRVVDEALDRGVERAEAAFATSPVTAAALFLQGASRVVGSGASARAALLPVAHPGQNAEHLEQQVGCDQ